VRKVCPRLLPRCRCIAALTVFVCICEDPLTSGEYGARFVKAMQARSADGRTLRVTAAPKHYLNYDMEGRKDSWQSDWGPSRNDFNAIVSKQEQVEYYLAQFHRMITVGQPGAFDSLPLSTPQLQVDSFIIVEIDQLRWEFNLEWSI
jgi:beta-glucosidase-like glycosyl hydrolase